MDDASPPDFPSETGGTPQKLQMRGMAEPRRGVLYVAWGEAHVEVARRSAATVKKHNPWLETAIFCHAGDDTRGFDHAMVIPDGMRRPKVNLLPESPFEETLFLDNDTLVRADLRSMFRLLEKYTLCGAQVVLWHRPRHLKSCGLDLPDAFPEINTGVLLYRKGAEIARFCSAWAERFEEAGYKIDQPSFREVLWESDIAFGTLPPQFNKRIYEASEVLYSDQPRPRILHLPILRPQRNPLKAWFANLLR